MVEQAEYLNKKSELEVKFFQLCHRALVDLDVSIYDLQYVEREQTLRLFIENPTSQTATLEECSTVDHSLTDYIHESDFVPEGLVLEVSSPGIFRHLSSKEHFKKNVGKRVSVHLKKKLDLNDSAVKRVIGALQEVMNDGFVMKEEESGQLVTLPFDLIKKANVEPHWDDIKQTEN